MVDAHAARFASGRHAGVLVPLFSIPSRRSWGIGEIPDLIPLGRWLRSAGLDFVQILPVNEMQEGQNSPYSALTAMAIDPIYIALADVPDFVDAGGESSLAPDDRARLDAVRRATSVNYRTVRALKHAALWHAFDCFMAVEWRRGSARAAALRDFTDTEGWWLHDYALFRALHDEHAGAHWRDWTNGARGPREYRSSTRLEESMLRYEYFQWIASTQWLRVREALSPVGIFGDFPFTVSANSADVWARQHEFEVDASVGVPPDAFSATGQDWGLPAYRWNVVAATGFAWLRDRARRCATLYDGFRIDHLVGFYRTYARRADGTASFTPPDEKSQRALGEQLLSLFAASGAAIVAEDLGTVPDFVRESLAHKHVPGIKVLRWEREWNLPGQPFRDPGTYPAESVATSGTHDTEPLAEWWDTADVDEKRALLELSALRHAGCVAEDAYSIRTRDALLETLFAARSALLILPIQDIFGWRDRINTPALVGDENWTWRLPWPVEDLMSDALAVERACALAGLAQRYQRG
jgi:4-alpha-glucanotransferase